MSRTPLTIQQFRRLTALMIANTPLDLTDDDYNYNDSDRAGMAKRLNIALHRQKLSEREKAIAHKLGQKLLLGMRKSQEWLHGDLIPFIDANDKLITRVITSIPITNNANKKTIEVVAVNGFDLGLPKGSPYDEVYRAGEKIGFVLANAEIGFEYVLQDPNLVPTQIRCFVAMDPLPIKIFQDDNQEEVKEVILKIEYVDGKYIISAHEVKKRIMFGANSYWLFMRPCKK